MAGKLRDRTDLGLGSHDMSDHPEFSVEQQIKRRVEQFRGRYWFKGQTAEQLWRWQVKHRQQLRRAMRLELPAVYVPPHAEVVESSCREGLRVELVGVETEPGFHLPVHVLRPPGECNGRTIIALHGEGRGADDVIGLADDDNARRHIDEFQYDYGDSLARAGFVVAAPDLRGYGRLMMNDDRQRRDAGPSEQLWRSSAQRLMGIYLRLGQTYAGCCVADIIRLVDYLENRQDVDPDRIGIAGMGEGARVLSWAVAIEDRFSAAAVAAMKRADADTLLEPRSGPPAMIEGRTLVDHASIFGCYTPRPLFLQGGRRDKETPIEHFQDVAEHLSQLYRVCGAEDRLTIDVHGQGRIFKRENAVEFFENWL